MAVGDIVGGISADNTTLEFTPAAGVEVVITSVNSIAAQPPRLTDGTLDSDHGIATTNQYSLKFFITNDEWLQIDNLGAGKFSAFTGITIG